MIQHNNNPQFVLNKETGCYEAIFRVEVTDEIFRNMVFQALKEDELGDLTQIATLQRAVSQVTSKLLTWIDRPHVKVTPVAFPVPREPEREDKLMPPPVEEV